MLHKCICAIMHRVQLVSRHVKHLRQQESTLYSRSTRFPTLSHKLGTSVRGHQYPALQVSHAHNQFIYYSVLPWQCSTGGTTHSIHDAFMNNIIAAFHKHVLMTTLHTHAHIHSMQNLTYKVNIILETYYIFHQREQSLVDTRCT